MNCTGKRNGASTASAPSRAASGSQASSACSSVGPWYQGMDSLAIVMLSPVTALTGIVMTSGTSRRAAVVRTIPVTSS